MINSGISSTQNPFPVRIITHIRDITPRLTLIINPKSFIRPHARLIPTLSNKSSLLTRTTPCIPTSTPSSSERLSGGRRPTQARIIRVRGRQRRVVTLVAVRRRLHKGLQTGAIELREEGADDTLDEAGEGVDAGQKCGLHLAGHRVEYFGLERARSVALGSRAASWGEGYLPGRST